MVIVNFAHNDKIGAYLFRAQSVIFVVKLSDIKFHINFFLTKKVSQFADGD